LNVPGAIVRVNKDCDGRSENGSSAGFVRSCGKIGGAGGVSLAAHQDAASWTSPSCSREMVDLQFAA
jgi:hypothetical protein